MTKKEFEDKLADDFDAFAHKTIVPYCTIGWRSGKYSDSLKSKHPSLNVYNGPGVLLWAFHGAPFTCNGEETTVVHTFSSNFAVLPSTHTASSLPWWKALFVSVKSLVWVGSE
eukprot:TRINITY_DN12617_c0_g1_i3.p1 TRINITY_DN12617_c0_g1~~TRINITY_DN12617_c0_g1_i3.p1  ORF type:complete len:113 (+),score=11.37 TRINITY_DN12617_c0_g1_i3:229-567(+)